MAVGCHATTFSRSWKVPGPRKILRKALEGYQRSQFYIKIGRRYISFFVPNVQMFAWALFLHYHLTWQRWVSLTSKVGCHATTFSRSWKVPGPRKILRKALEAYRRSIVLCKNLFWGRVAKSFRALIFFVPKKLMQVGIIVAPVT